MHVETYYGMKLAGELDAWIIDTSSETTPIKEQTRLQDLFIELDVKR
jgi:hypothetical protein